MGVSKKAARAVESKKNQERRLCSQLTEGQPFLPVCHNSEFFDFQMAWNMQPLGVCPGGVKRSVVKK